MTRQQRYNYITKILRDMGYPLSEVAITGLNFSVQCVLPNDTLGQQGEAVEFAQQYAHEADTGFLDVIYTDETSIHN